MFSRNREQGRVRLFKSKPTTKPKYLVAAIFLIAIAGCYLFAIRSLPAKQATAENSRQSKQELIENYGKIPLAFEANEGQTNSQAKFISRGSGYSLFLTAEEAVFTLRRSDKERSAVLRMKPLGANPSPKVTGIEEMESKSNYFIGNDPEKWRTNVANYEKVKYEEVYSGIDLVYYGNQRQLEYDFIVKPGADYREIALRFDGADKVEIDRNGELVLQIGGEQVRQHRPVIYQEENGERLVVAGNYTFKSSREVGFEVGAYDESRPLVIDPVLLYSTYLGGSNSSEIANDIAIDAAGNAYVTGQTTSADFPITPGAFDTTFNGGTFDAFVTKLNPSGSALVYSTYLGGSGGGISTGPFDQGFGIAVDAGGNVYITGVTNSTDFPTTPGAFDTTFNGQADAFITKLNPSGSALEYSTYLGGSGLAHGDQGNSIAVDAAGNAYVIGTTSSADFPTTPGAFDTTLIGDDAFVTKLNPSGSELVYSTYLGSDNPDEGRDITIDAAGNAYVTGFAGSDNFPITPGAFDTTFSGGDAFVTKLNPSGSELIYSTYLGGSNGTSGNGIAVDAAGNAYVTGSTISTDFPTTPGAFDTTHGGSADAFVTKLNPSGSELVYSTYLGGNDLDQGFGIVVDAAGNAYVTGRTLSADFPTTPGAFDTTHGGSTDAFVTKLNPSGSELVYSTYLGGNTTDDANSIAVDAAGDAYVTGITGSADFPTTPGAFDTTFNGGDAFISKINEPNSPPTALADGPYLGIAGTPITLDASASNDPDDDDLTYKWDFGDGTTLTTTDAIIQHTYANGGVFNITLVANDGQVDSAPFSTQATIGFNGTGQRDDVDEFLSYANPLSREMNLPAGTTSFQMVIIYGPTIIPSTFSATLEKANVTNLFHPAPNTSETVTIPLSRGRNSLFLKVDGIRTDGHTATDRDQLVFVVQ
jgi:hypothetical protein